MPTRQGSLRIFTLAGIGVYVHWLWLVVALFSFQYRTHEYSSLVWNAAEYLGLFFIVLLHEFGHQLACRSVGGQTHDIVLWPLGGVAYVSPPQRPGAQLWSIAAGPLVNVALIPIFAALVSASNHLGWEQTNPDACDFVHNLWWLNIGLLIFNLVPVFPLDGGQILRSLLWFLFGRANSLLVASIIGFIGVAGFILLAVWAHSVWMGVMTAFIALNCWGGLRQALALSKRDKQPRREGYACPACKAAPPQGEFWRCGKCGGKFDTFQTLAICPHCRTEYNSTQCVECGVSRPIGDWCLPPPLPPATGATS